MFQQNSVGVRHVNSILWFLIVLVTIGWFQSNIDYSISSIFGWSSEYSWTVKLDCLLLVINNFLIKLIISKIKNILNSDKFCDFNDGRIFRNTYLDWSKHHLNGGPYIKILELAIKYLCTPASFFRKSSLKLVYYCKKILQTFLKYCW